MGDLLTNRLSKYIIPALLLTLTPTFVSKNETKKRVIEESASSAITQEDYIHYDSDSVKIKTAEYLFKVWDDVDTSDNSLIISDDFYNHDYVSSIPLDEDYNYAPWTHMSQTSREWIYLAMYRKLDIEDYKEMFKWLKNFRQWKLGNCYFVVAIKNLARSKYFDTLMMTSIKRTWENSFNLYMPLWEPEWVKIPICEKDLKQSSIWWPIWYKILEIWFAKYLLFKKWIIPDPNIVITDKLMKKMEVGSVWETMLSLLWPKSFANKCIKNEKTTKSSIMNGLQNFDPKDLSTISISSKTKKWKTDKNFYEIWWERIYYGHAYSLCGIEKEWDVIKNVVLDNPWNNENKEWGHRITLSIDDFFDCFSLINIWHKTDNFLNLSTFKDEIKVIDSRDRRKS